MPQPATTNEEERAGQRQLLGRPYAAHSQTSNPLVGGSSPPGGAADLHRCRISARTEYPWLQLSSHWLPRGGLTCQGGLRRTGGTRRPCTCTGGKELGKFLVEINNLHDLRDVDIPRATSGPAATSHQFSGRSRSALPSGEGPSWSETRSSELNAQPKFGIKGSAELRFSCCVPVTARRGHKCRDRTDLDRC